MILKSYILIITKSEKRHQNTVRNHLIVPALGRHLWPCGCHFAQTGRFHKAKVEAMVAALRRENNRYLAAIANVSAAVAELSDTVEALQRQLGACNVAASQALRMVL